MEGQSGRLGQTCGHDLDPAPPIVVGDGDDFVGTGDKYGPAPPDPHSARTGNVAGIDLDMEAGRQFELSEGQLVPRCGLSRCRNRRKLGGSLVSGRPLGRR